MSKKRTFLIAANGNSQNTKPPVKLKPNVRAHILAAIELADWCNLQVVLQVVVLFLDCYLFPVVQLFAHHWFMVVDRCMLLFVRFAALKMDRVVLWQYFELRCSYHPKTQESLIYKFFFLQGVLNAE